MRLGFVGGGKLGCLKISSVLGLASAAADLPLVQTDLLWTGTAREGPLHLLLLCASMTQQENCTYSSYQSQVLLT